MGAYTALTADRLLARSLLDEYCAGSAPAPVPVDVDTEQPRLSNNPNGRPPTWTPAATLTALRQFTARYHRPPTRAEWRTATAYGLPSYSTAYRQWGSVDLAYAESQKAPV